MWHSVICGIPSYVAYHCLLHLFAMFQRNPFVDEEAEDEEEEDENDDAGTDILDEGELHLALDTMESDSGLFILWSLLSHCTTINLYVGLRHISNKIKCH